MLQIRLFSSLILLTLMLVIPQQSEAQRAQNYEQRQAWELGCYNKRGASCDAIAKHWDAVAKAGGERGVTPKAAFSRKMDWARRGCDYGGQYSCDALGWASEHGEETLASDPVAAHRYYKKGCVNGSAYSCSNLGGTYYFGFGVAADKNLGQQYFQKACQMGLERGCERLQIAKTEQVLGDLEPACQGESSLACYRIARLFATGTGVSKDPFEAAQYYDRTCRIQSDAHGCLLYGIYLMDNRAAFTPEQSDSLAFGVFDRACRFGHSKTCAALDATKDKNIIVKTVAVRKAACQAGLVDACWSAFQWYNGKSWLDAMRMGEEGCKLSVPELCHNAGMVAMKNPNAVGPPYANAIDNFRFGCNLGYAPSCVGLDAAMYKDRQWRDVTFSSNDSGIGKFLSDLGRGIGIASTMDVPRASSSPTFPSVATSGNTSSNVQQDNRDFQNAINATNNIGTGYNSTCPASNPYC